MTNGKIFFNTLDGQTIAVDANSGQQVWRTQLGDIQKGETITMAPLVADGKVLVGNSGGEMGVRGWIAALDEGSGKLAWKAYQHRARQGRADRLQVQALLRDGPGQGPRRQDLAARSVEDRRRHRLGLDQLRSRDQDSSITAPAIRGRGTPTSGPATTSGRPASSPATSTPARRVWFYQTTPHDLFDHDDINEIDPRRHPVGQWPPAGAAPPGAQRLLLCAWTAAPARCCRRRPTAT